MKSSSTPGDCMCDWCQPGGAPIFAFGGVDIPGGGGPAGTGGGMPGGGGGACLPGGAPGGGGGGIPGGGPRLAHDDDGARPGLDPGGDPPSCPDIPDCDRSSRVVPGGGGPRGGGRAGGRWRCAGTVRSHDRTRDREAAGEPRVMRRGAGVLAGAGDHPRRRRRRRRRSSSQAASSSSPRWTPHPRRRARGTAVAFPPARSRRRRAAPWHAPGLAADGRSPSPASPRAPAVPRLQPRRAARRPTSSSQPPASEHLHPRS
jgi:hypothetical protein